MALCGHGRLFKLDSEAISGDAIVKVMQRRRRLQLRSSLLNSWEDWRADPGRWALAVLALSQRSTWQQPKKKKYNQLVIVDEVAGPDDDEDSFSDVDKYLLDYFTLKAVRTVLQQLFEMNPSQYTWFYTFIVNNKPQDGKIFLQLLVKERQELGERVMITRLYLFNKWMKQYDHAKMHEYISNENVKLLRERLTQTIKFASDDDDVPSYDLL